MELISNFLVNYDYESDDNDGYGGVDAQEVQNDPEEPLVRDDNAILDAQEEVQYEEPWVHVDNEIIIEDHNVAIPPIDEWFPQNEVFELAPVQQEYYGDYESIDIYQL